MLKNCEKTLKKYFSLLHRDSEEEGILDYYKENNITFFAYMVLEQGALTGKYDTKNPMPENSARGKIYNPVLDKLELLNLELKKLSDKYNVQIPQIPIAWAIYKGTLPIIGVTKIEQIDDVVKAMKVNLSKEDVENIENFAKGLEINVIRFWEKEMK